MKFLLLNIILVLSACAINQNSAGEPTTETQPIAFPGAEGFGKYATGGRGGKVFIVSNLDDSGPGSFREAAESKGKRIIVFSVSGTIHLKTAIRIGGHVTIAGQTAPGDGICIADQPLNLVGDNIIIRYLRIRLGDRLQRAKGKVDGSGSDDALSGIGRKHIIIDHCSLSWSNDEVLTLYNGDSSTLQWNIISEPLNYSYHFEKGDTDYQQHGYGGIWGGRNLSAHHNLFAHCVSRNPRFCGIRYISSEFVDFRNNVIYNWGINNTYGGEGGNYNIVGNYYKHGPSTSKSTRYRIVNPSRQQQPVIGYGKYFVSGNYVDGSPETTNDNSLGVHPGSGGNAGDKDTIIVDQAFAHVAISTQTATDAYNTVLQHAGASLPTRDTLDERIISDVKNRTGKIIDVQGGFAHGTAYELTAGAWPALKSEEASKDSDADGMPDDWESKNGLNPADASDSSQKKLHAFYTNIEVYINSLVK